MARTGATRRDAQPRPRKPATPTQNGSAARTPPHDLEAEEAILGAAMVARPALAVLSTQLRPEDFYVPAHSDIAAALMRLHDEHAPVDPVTVADVLSRDGLLEGAGGIQKLRWLQVQTPASAHAPRYARSVAEKARLRRLLACSAELTEELYSRDHEPEPGPMLTNLALLSATVTAGPLFEDIGLLLDQGVAPIEPELLVRSDGSHLLYLARMNAFQGEPGDGKTTLAYMACVQVLTAGGVVVVIDFEDTAYSGVAKILALGADPYAVRTRFHYHRAEHLDHAARAGLVAAVLHLGPQLVVIDGVAAALAQDGLDENLAPDYLTWLDTLARPIAAGGPAVLLIDHVTKSKEDRGRWARGSGAKLAAIDGAAYSLVADPPFSRTTPGRIKLVVAKDRPGGVGPARATVALIHIEPDTLGRLDWRISPSVFTDEDGKPATGPAVSDELLKAVIFVLEDLAGEGPLSKRRIAPQIRARNVTFKNLVLDEALARLERDQLVICQPGPRGALLYSLPARQQTLEGPG